MDLNNRTKSKRCLLFIINCFIALFICGFILVCYSVFHGKGTVALGAEKMTVYVSDSLRLDKSEIITLKQEKKAGYSRENGNESAEPMESIMSTENIPLVEGEELIEYAEPMGGRVLMESAEPTGSAEPTMSAEPTGSAEPTMSAEPTGSAEPTMSAEPTGSAEPTESASPTITPTQIPPNSVVVSHLISLEYGRKVDLSRFVTVRGGSSSLRNKAKIEYTILDIGKGTSKASVSKTSGMFSAKRIGKVYVKIQGRSKGSVFDSLTIAVNIVNKSNVQTRVKARKLDIAMGRLKLSKKITAKNIASYYNAWYSVDKSVRAFSQYSIYRNVKHDGKINYLGLTNDKNYCLVRDKIGKYLYGKQLGIKSISYISEYEGFVITWSHKIGTIDYVSYAFKNKKRYSKKMNMTVGVTLSGAANGTGSVKTESASGKRQSLVVKLTRGMRLVQVKPAKSTLQTGKRILEIKSFYRTISRTCRFAMIYKNSKKIVFPKKVIAVRNATRGGSVVAYTNVYRSYRCVHTGSNGWYRIRLGGGKIGYVRKKDMAASQPKSYSAVSVSKKVYGYKDMENDIEVLRKRYPSLLSVSVLAKTVDKNNIYCIRLGNANAKHRVVLQSTMHAREWLNIQFVMANIEHYCRNYYAGEYKEISFSRLFNNVCFYIVPLSNPDGASLSQYGLKGIKSKKLRKNIKKIGKGQYRRWKANARGVDLNRNFSHGFGLVKSGEKKPSAMYYAGKTAFSERESRALKKLVERVKPEIVLNYHQVGEVIYHNDEGELLDTVQKLTGYMPIAESATNAGDGSMGSWLTYNNIQWCTIETGVGMAPVSHSQFKTVWKQNKNVVAAVAELLLDDDKEAEK